MLENDITQIPVLRRLSAHVECMKSLLLEHFGFHRSCRSPARVIQRWWRREVNRRRCREKEKVAAEKIEAWWIGTIMRKKIALAKATGATFNATFIIELVA